jgi:hypothetical membrane protein
LGPREQTVDAFPNAYVSTDEPPARSFIKRGLCVVSAAGVGSLGLVILALNFISTEYSPITQAASDYGVGTYALEMNTAFFFAGLGFLCLAFVALGTAKGRAAVAGSAAMVPAGVALLFDGFYHADIEGAAVTLNGTIHAVAGVLFFSTASLGLLLMSGQFGRNGRRLVRPGFLVAFAFLVLDGLLGLDASGLAERIVILVVFSSAIANSVRFYGSS